MISRRTATTLNLTILLILGGLFLAAASESSPRQVPPGEFILEGANKGMPDSTRVVPVYQASPTGNWVIHYDPNTPLSEKWEYVHRIGGTIVERIEALEIWVVDVPDAFGSADFSFDSDVELVEQDFIVSVQFDNPPNDPDYDRQWALPHIQAETAWDQMGELSDITVAVIDTGVCMSHEDLLGRVLDNGYDFVEDDDDPEDVFGHGCSVAGIIAANIDNGIGIAGFAPNSSILPVRVLGPSGSGSMADVAAGIVYAADNGAEIINLSLGSMVGSQVTEDAVRHAIGKGVTVIASAGNSGGALPGFPARYENVVAVGAIDPDGARSSFSNKGGDIWAPGRDVHTTYLDNGYKALNGTSFSAPYVAAMAAVLEGMGGQLHLDGGDMTWTCMREGACEIVPGS
ncbi:MAG: S8 family serine peptidase [Chloroflexi bacterium]|nr:S8 family serine peptidase [Chloroflexota bacterium]